MTSKLTAFKDNLFTSGFTCASLSLFVIGLSGGSNIRLGSGDVWRFLAAAGGALGVSSLIVEGVEGVVASKKRERELPVFFPLPSLPSFSLSKPQPVGNDDWEEEILKIDTHHQGRLRLTTRWPVLNPTEFVHWLYTAYPELFEDTTRPEVLVHYPHPAGGMAYHIVIATELFPLAAIAAIDSVVAQLNEEDSACFWEFHNGVLSSAGASKLSFYDVETVLI